MPDSFWPLRFGRRYDPDAAWFLQTGFLARNYFLFNRPQWMDEPVEHVSKAFPGLTMNCARLAAGTSPVGCGCFCGRSRSQTGNG
ncbi:MAG: hypothetical protein ACKO2P_12605, partial [Planctomycetota bacterium]